VCQAGGELADALETLVELTAARQAT
jgi:hypothetical protein